MYKVFLTDPTTGKWASCLLLQSHCAAYKAVQAWLSAYPSGYAEIESKGRVQAYPLDCQRTR